MLTFFLRCFVLVLLSDAGNCWAAPSTGARDGIGIELDAGRSAADSSSGAVEQAAWFQSPGK